MATCLVSQTPFSFRMSRNQLGGGYDYAGWNSLFFFFQQGFRVRKTENGTKVEVWALDRGSLSSPWPQVFYCMNCQRLCIAFYCCLWVPFSPGWWVLVWVKALSFTLHPALIGLAGIQWCIPGWQRAACLDFVCNLVIERTLNWTLRH